MSKRAPGGVRTHDDQNQVCFDHWEHWAGTEKIDELIIIYMGKKCKKMHCCTFFEKKH